MKEKAQKWSSGTRRRFRLVPPAIAAVGGLLLAGCFNEPARDNPADPGSPDYDESARLVVFVLDQKEDPLADALVRLIEPNRAVYTDTAGRATFDVPADTVNYAITSDGYVPVSGNVVLPARQSVTIDEELNGKPRIDSVNVHTEMEQNPVDQSRFQYRYQFDAYVDDVDGHSDVDSVTLYDPLQPDTTIDFRTTETERKLSASQQLGFNRDAIVDRLGLDFRIVLIDRQGDSAQVSTQIGSYLYYPYLFEDMNDSSPYSIGDMWFEWENPAENLWYNPRRFRVEIFQGGADEPFLDTLIVFEETHQDSLFRLHLTQTGGFDDSAHTWRLTMYDPTGNLVKTKPKYFTPQF